MAPYSLDLRQKLLPAHERWSGSQRALAELFGVSVSFVEKLLRRQRATGTVAPKPPGGGPSRRLDAADADWLRQWVHEPPDLTLAELGERLANATGKRTRVPTLCRALARLHLPRQKSRSMPRSAIRRE